MSIIAFFIGLFILAMGFGYLYRPDTVQKINSWVRENLFNDRLLLINRRKVGVMLLFIGAIIIYFAIK